MSNWTHVAGIIRMDLFDPYENSNIDFDELLGKEIRFGDPIEEWNDVDKNPNKYLPMGSEGSLTKSIWENPDISCIAKYTISIFGDLRDHDDPNKVIEWFKKICTKIDDTDETIGGSIRNATITVENEWNGTVNWTYEDSKE